MCRCNQITKNRLFLQLKAKKYYTNTCNVNTLPFLSKCVNRRKRGMNVSATSLSKLISTRKEELARLLEYRGTDFPVVERQNDLRISFIELELADLEKLNKQPQLNENQQASINEAKKCYRKGTDLYDCSIDMLICDGLPDKEWAESTVAFLTWALEQEEE